MAYIIGAFNKFDSWDRTHSIYTFKINDNWYAIKEIEMEWGLPKLQQHVDKDMAREAASYYIYDSYEQAMEFVNMMKSLN